MLFFANLLLDYSLIFGKFGFPELGVRGAAIATVIARIAEVAVVMAWAHSHTAEKPFIRGVYRSFHVPMDLVKEVIKKGTPLLLNETLWAGGMAMLVRCYSSRGLVVVAGINIATTLSNMFSIVYIAMGSAIGIILGQLLGAGKMEEAVDTDRKLIFFSVASCLGVAILMIIVSPFFPQIYNTSDDVKCSCGMDHPGAGSLYAIERIYEFNLFYSTFRRKDDRYLFIRQLLYLGCRHSGSYFAHQLYRLECDPCIFLSADAGNCKMYHRLCAGKKRRMAEQYDHQSSKQLIFMEWNLRADAGGLMKCKIFSNEYGFGSFCIFNQFHPIF